MSRQATQRSATAGSSHARCVKVAAVPQPGKALVASAAAALLVSLSWVCLVLGLLLPGS
jgi:hypothetical protein